VPLTDLAEPELSAYTSAVTPPADLESFWNRTLSEARAMAWPTTSTAVATGLRLVTTFDVTFSGYDGDPVRAWYHRPADTDAPLPVIVNFQGYGGGRGLPHQISHWVAAGYACVEVDTRGQGSGHTPGDTPDPSGSGPAYPGYMTRGIASPDSYYYRRVFTDAVRALDCVRELAGIDPSRVAVTGGSQGGGICIAVAGLADGVTAALPDVPFLSDYRRGAEIAIKAPYTEIAGYLATHPDQVARAFETLSYFDASVLGRSASASALFSVALMDQICPPSTVYAAYNSYAGVKEIRRYAFNDHEGGHVFHQAEQLRWLINLMPPSH
jgi:cephalosporin-C deacetylase